MKIQNRITGIGNWTQVCALCRAMANSLEKPDPGLAYIATDSLGGRRWESGVEQEVEQRPSHDGVYLGFAETSLNMVEFTSATSGAVIRAKKKVDGRWVFRFKGANVALDGRESGYATTFEGLNLEVLSKNLPFEAEWAKSAHWKYLARRSLAIV